MARVCTISATVVAACNLLQGSTDPCKRIQARVSSKTRKGIRYKGSGTILQISMRACLAGVCRALQWYLPHELPQPLQEYLRLQFAARVHRHCKPIQARGSAKTCNGICNKGSEIPAQISFHMCLAMVSRPSQEDLPKWFPHSL